MKIIQSYKRIVARDSPSTSTKRSNYLYKKKFFIKIDDFSKLPQWAGRVRSGKERKNSKQIAEDLPSNLKKVS